MRLKRVTRIIILEISKLRISTYPLSLRVLNFTRTRVKFFFAHSPPIRAASGFAAHNPFNTVRVFILHFEPPHAQNHGFFRPTSFHSVKFGSTPKSRPKTRRTTSIYTTGTVAKCHLGIKSHRSRFFPAVSRPNNVCRILKTRICRRTRTCAQAFRFRYCA